MEYLIYLLATFGGSFIQAISGFGFGIFVMMIFPSIFPAAFSTTLSGLLSMTVSFYLVYRYRKKCNFKRLIFLIIGFFLFSLPAVILSSISPNEILVKILAVTLILMSIYFLIFEKRIKIKESKITAFICGGLSGLLGGFFAMSGPPVVAYLLQTSDDNETYYADIQLYFSITNIFTATLRAASGLITIEVLKLFIIGLAVLIIGTVLGKLIANKINGPVLRKIVYSIMALSGVVLLIK